MHQRWGLTIPDDSPNQYTCILCMGSNLTNTKYPTFLDTVILTRNLLKGRIQVTNLLGMKILILLVEIFLLANFVISSTTEEGGGGTPKHINGKGTVKCRNPRHHAKMKIVF